MVTAGLFAVSFSGEKVELEELSDAIFHIDAKILREEKSTQKKNSSKNYRGRHGRYI